MRGIPARLRSTVRSRDVEPGHPGGGRPGTAGCGCPGGGLPPGCFQAGQSLFFIAVRDPQMALRRPCRFCLVRLPLGLAEAGDFLDQGDEAGNQPVEPDHGAAAGPEH
jgi:hypothetical protein